ncbi:MAG: hydrogenase maturation nickel metallochaperone HypA [Candidatus Hydrothermales bacterium]
MHEYSLATNLIEILKEEKRKRNLKKILKVEIEFGKLSAAEPLILKEIFDIIKKQTEFEDTELVIDVIEPEIKCLKCDEIFKATTFPFLCPFCENVGGQILKGDKITVKSLELIKD